MADDRHMLVSRDDEMPSQPVRDTPVRASPVPASPVPASTIRDSTAAIVAAARASVLEVGVRRTTLSDVARRAGVSRMTVYRQFTDTDGLLRTLLTAELGSQVAAALETATGDDARSRLVDGTLAALDAISHDPLLRRVIDVDPEVLVPFLVDRQGSSQRAAEQVVVALLHEGVADGSISCEDPEAAAGVLVLTVQSFVVSSRITAARPDAARLRDQLRLMLERFLAP